MSISGKLDLPGLADGEGHVVLTHAGEFRTIASSKSISNALRRSFHDEVLPVGSSRVHRSWEPEILVGGLGPSHVYVSFGWILPDDITDPLSGRSGLVYFYGRVFAGQRRSVRIVRNMMAALASLAHFYTDADQLIADQHIWNDRPNWVRQLLLDAIGVPDQRIPPI